METTTEFDFAKTESVYNYNITPNINLCISRLNNGVAVVYFTDELHNKINVPTGIEVYECDFEDKIKKSALRSKGAAYPLCWTDDYTIVYNKVVLLEIKNQRKWNIIS